MLDTVQLKDRIVEVALERKAQDIAVIDIRGRSSYADFLVLASGTSDRHVQSIAELVDHTLSKEGTRSMGREGLREGQWALIDFGSVVCHIFHHFTRGEFNLESLWKDAPQEQFAAATADTTHEPGYASDDDDGDDWAPFNA